MRSKAELINKICWIITALQCDQLCDTGYVRLNDVRLIAPCCLLGIGFANIQVALKAVRWLAFAQ